MWEGTSGRRTRVSVLRGAVIGCIVLAGCTASPPRGSGGSSVAIVGDSMFAAHSQDKIGAWALARFGTYWFRAANGAGFFNEPTHGLKLWDQLPPLGSYPPVFVVSEGWNDTVVGGFDTSAILAEVDAFLDHLDAEGVTCVVWLLNRDDESKFIDSQKFNWARGSALLPPSPTLAEITAAFDEGMSRLRDVNDHLRSRAAGPIGSGLQLSLVEWGALVDSKSVLVTVPAGLGPATQIWWSGMFDKGAVVGPDQQLGWPDNDLDTVHPGYFGSPSGSEVEVSRLDDGVDACGL